MSRSKWKPSFVDIQLLDEIIKKKGKGILRTKSRTSIILKEFIGLTIEVYNGRNFIKLYIDKTMVGKKLGEFSFTRKLGKIHKNKFDKK